MSKYVLQIKNVSKDFIESFAVLLLYESVDRNTFCMKVSSLLYKKNVLLSTLKLESHKLHTQKNHSILVLLITIEINNFSNILHFQLLLCVVISFRVVRK